MNKNARALEQLVEELIRYSIVNFNNDQSIYIGNISKQILELRQFFDKDY